MAAEAVNSELSSSDVVHLLPVHWKTLEISWPGDCRFWELARWNRTANAMHGSKQFALWQMSEIVFQKIFALHQFTSESELTRSFWSVQPVQLALQGKLASIAAFDEIALLLQGFVPSGFTRTQPGFTFWIWQLPVIRCMVIEVSGVGISLSSRLVRKAPPFVSSCPCLKNLFAWWRIMIQGERFFGWSWCLLIFLWMLASSRI